jgi:hypothetical protein
VKTFKIVGSRSVAGKTPGSVVSADELAGSNVTALIEAGHLAPAPNPKPAKPDLAEEN